MTIQREVRSAAGKLSTSGNTIRGYAAVWDSYSQVLSEGGRTFREKISRGAFANSLANPPHGDIVALWNHGDNGSRPPLGRVSAKTLRLWEDDHGLAFELTAPNWAGDIVESVARGDVDGCSFGMLAGTRSTWEYQDGMAVRTLVEVRLDEISLVITPAYPDTSVGVRNYSPCDVPDEPDLSHARLRVARAKTDLHR